METAWIKVVLIIPMYFCSWNLTFLGWCTINRLSCSWQCMVRRNRDVPRHTYQAPASQHVNTSPGLSSRGEEELEVPHEVSFGAGPSEHQAAQQPRGQAGPELRQPALPLPAHCMAVPYTGTEPTAGAGECPQSSSGRLCHALCPVLL